MTDEQEDEPQVDEPEETLPGQDDDVEGGVEAESPSAEEVSEPAEASFAEDDPFTAEFSVHPQGDGYRSTPRESPLGDLATRLLRVGAEAVNQTTGRLREAGEDVKPREILSGAVRMTAKGREEVVGLVAKEVRMYLEKLRVGEELRALMTDHSLEIQASVRLKPLGGEGGEAEGSGE
jgi:hypothetical protein